MTHNELSIKSQERIQIESKIDHVFNRFRISSLLHRCRIRKRHGYGVRFLMETIFTLPFLGKNFFRGIVKNDDANIGKDAAYDMLKGSTYNWRRLLLTPAVRIYANINQFTGGKRESVLIFDHSTGQYLRGFCLLHLCMSDGVSTLPLDFALLFFG